MLKGLEAPNSGHDGILEPEIVRRVGSELMLLRRGDLRGQIVYHNWVCKVIILTLNALDGGHSTQIGAEPARAPGYGGCLDIALVAFRLFLVIQPQDLQLLQFPTPQEPDWGYPVRKTKF